LKEKKKRRREERKEKLFPIVGERKHQGKGKESLGGTSKEGKKIDSKRGRGDQFPNPKKGRKKKKKQGKKGKRALFPKGGGKRSIFTTGKKEIT